MDSMNDILGEAQNILKDESKVDFEIAQIHSLKFTIVLIFEISCSNQ